MSGADPHGWSWTRCDLIDRLMEIARRFDDACMAMARKLEAVLDPIFMSPATWWLIGWARSSDRWWS